MVNGGPLTRQRVDNTVSNFPNEVHYSCRNNVTRFTMETSIKETGIGDVFKKGWTLSQRSLAFDIDIWSFERNAVDNK